MEIRAGNDAKQFRWDTSNDNDVEHGKFAAQTWKFKAAGTTTVLHFRSKDPKSSSRGAVIATISVTNVTTNQR
jgi:hypothetical protein